MDMEPKKRLPVLKWATIVGIVIVLNLFFSVAISVVYPQPEFDDFCEQRQIEKPIADEDACIAIGGQWTATPKLESEEISGHCNRNFICAQEYENARDAYQRNVFIALVVLGIISLVGGVVLSSYSAVSVGLSYGGVLTFIIASIRYWDAAPNVVKLVIVGVALAVLLFVAARKFRE